MRNERGYTCRSEVLYTMPVIPASEKLKQHQIFLETVVGAVQHSD